MKRPPLPHRKNSEKRLLPTVVQSKRVISTDIQTDTAKSATATRYEILGGHQVGMKKRTVNANEASESFSLFVRFLLAVLRADGKAEDGSSPDTDMVYSVAWTG